MNTYTTCFLLSLAIAISLPASASATNAGSVGASAALPIYTPPLRGAPANRIGGGTRGVGAPRLALEVIAPDDHTGLTSAAQPRLYWYASEPVSAPIDFTLLAGDAEQPVVEQRLPAVTEPGIQPVALSSLGATLKPGIEYRWFVSVVIDATQRSRHVTAGGNIRLEDANKQLRARLRKADERTAPLIFAQAGYFYDAIDGLSQLIARNPKDAGLRDQRAALLEQVGLEKVAAADRAGAAR